MTANELALMLGNNDIKDSDILLLELYIDAGIEYINNFFKERNVDITVTKDNVPPALKIAIKQFAEITQLNSTVASESIGGMSATYITSTGNNNNKNIYASLDNYLMSFVSRKIKFKPFKG